VKQTISTVYTIKQLFSNIQTVSDITFIVLRGNIYLQYIQASATEARSRLNELKRGVVNKAILLIEKVALLHYDIYCNDLNTIR
jgi:hypothetical protein